MEEVGVSFEVSRKFSSLLEAAQFLSLEYCLELPSLAWQYEECGLWTPSWKPKYLFRGENGNYPTTLAQIHREQTLTLQDGSVLDAQDLRRLDHLLCSLVQCFSGPSYHTEPHLAVGLLQHYGFPTPLLDFTTKLKVAIAFAAVGAFEMGRICVLPVGRNQPAIGVRDLSEHPWCERPRRQWAYGVLLPAELEDLKSERSHSALGTRWYEFPVTREDKAFLRGPYDEAMRLDDDASAGFIRHHITEYVHAFGKFSDRLARWLLERVPKVPRCAEVRQIDRDGVIVHHRPANALPDLDLELEADFSRRYWSVDYPDSAADRLREWKWPLPVGTVYADPRTFHADLARRP